MGLILSALCGGIPPSTSISRKALLIGIRYDTARRYRQQDVPDLGVTPHNEVHTWRNILVKKFEYREEDVICMMDTVDCQGTTQWPSKENILNQLATLVRNTKPTDRRFLLIAGHGSQSACTSDQTELDGKDEVMHALEQDGNCTIIKDNDLRRILVDRLPRGASLRVIFELCNSGTLLDLPFRLQISKEDGKPTISDAKHKASDVQGDILCVSACEDAQNAHAFRDDQGAELGLITATISCSLGNARGQSQIKLPVVGLLRSLLEPVPLTDSPKASANSRQQTPMVTLGRKLKDEELSNLIFQP